MPHHTSIQSETRDIGKAEPNRCIIYMENVWASYDVRNTTIQEINMRVSAGSNYAIVGKSGSGKSTLLKIMNGLMMPSRGTIMVDGHRPDQRNGKFRNVMARIGYIPQSLGLVRNSSVLDNVMIGALPRMGVLQSLLKKYSEADMAEARRILEMVGLSGKENRKAYMLSGGEKRRVAIARAFMQNPRILLADEIVSELDSVTSRDIMELVSAMQKDTGLTAIMIHHDTNLALEYADRVAVMQEGRKIMEMGIDHDHILDFQSGNLTTQEILEMYDDSQK